MITKKCVICGIEFEAAKMRILSCSRKCGNVRRSMNLLGRPKRKTILRIQKEKDILKLNTSFIGESVSVVL